MPVVDVKMDFRERQNFFLKSVFVCLETKDGIQMEGKNWKFGISAQITPSLAVKEGEITAGVGVQKIPKTEG